MTKILTIFLLCWMTMTAWADDKSKFSAAEQQQISIATPGLFDKSDALEIDLSDYAKRGYSFPLPVGKASIKTDGSGMQISTKKGDAVKAMFDGQVRLAYKHPQFGNIIVIRHNNGFETVYGNNAQNLVKVGEKVKAGQTIAIVGSNGNDASLTFSIMINGRRINPETIFDIKAHKLKDITLKVKKVGEKIKIVTKRNEKNTNDGEGKPSNKGNKPDKGNSKSDKGNSKSENKNNKPDKGNSKPDKGNSKPDSKGSNSDIMAYTGEDSFDNSSSVTVDFGKISDNRWAYPLPGSHVISPYGGRRHHSGVDIKTKPKDDIVAAFDGKVISSGPFYGYGNCIKIQHANGIVTLYSHQSKNLVKAGDIVKAGQVIGLTGRTGRATTEHLHFELFCGGRRYDPAKLFDHGNHQLKNIKVKITRNGGMTVVK